MAADALTGEGGLLGLPVSTGCELAVPVWVGCPASFCPAAFPGTRRFCMVPDSWI